jgi:hypothetical protein
MKLKYSTTKPYLLCLGLSLEILTIALHQTAANATDKIKPASANTSESTQRGHNLGKDRRSATRSGAPTLTSKASTADISRVVAPPVYTEVAPTFSKSGSPTVIASTPPAGTPSVAPSPAAASPAAAEAVQILSPTPQTVLDVPAATVVVQYPQGSQLDLRVNGVAVPADLIGRTETDAKTQRVTQTWFGVSLQEGTNTLTAQTQQNGQTGPLATVKVQVRGDVKKLTVSTQESRIPADGKSTATVQGQLVDEQGNRSNRDGIVTLTSTAGEFIGADEDRDRPGFQVKARQGQFTANLRSGLEAKTVTIRATTDKLEAFTQVAFETSLRPSIATGVIDLRIGKRGTDFYQGFKEFLPIDGDYGTQFDLRAAAFATGRVGDWLFTGAFNNSRPLNQTCDGTSRLFRDQQGCDNTYPVYGDSSQSTVITPSIDSVYLRLERNSPVAGAGIDYAMWGDYNTEEFATESQQFTSITRQLHGFKANYNLGNLQMSAFYGNNVQGFQRDTLLPDGTSGFYFLSRRLLLEGSENVFLETEELNRPGTVIARKSLSRGPDYEIDYDRGTLLFRQPVLRTDIGKEGETLVRRIVVTYQYDTPGSNNNIYGGRVRYHLSRGLNQQSWIGATYLQENQGNRDFSIYGADAYISLGPKAHLITEYARSSNDSESLGTVTGSAYRLELAGEIAKGIQGEAYYRQADTGFANNATLSFVPGQTRYGAQVTAKVSPQTNLRLRYDHERNQGIAPRVLTNLDDLLTPRTEALPGEAVDNSLTTISAGIQQRLGAADLTVDWLHRSREDRLNTGLNTTSDQLRSRLTLPLTKTLTFLAQNELTLSPQVDAVYSDRTLLGLNWQAMPGVNVQLAQQFFTRGQYAGQAITSLNVLGDYKLGPDTTLKGRYSILGGADGMTMQGALGINQGIRLAPGLKLDLAYERVFGGFQSRTATETQFTAPFATGQSASALGLESGNNYSVGLEYTGSPDFKASARYEHRESSSGKNTVISATAAGKLSPSLTALLRYQQASTANQGLSGLGTTANLKVGLAYRDPVDDRFNALLRYEYRKNPNTIPDTILFGSGTGSNVHLFGLEAIYAPNWQWEFYGKFALRHSTSYLANDLVGTSTATLAQVRATYRFGQRWDLVGETRWINQSGGSSETGLALEAGYYLTPNLRLSGGYSFGRAHDNDFGSRSAGGFYGGITLKVNELFNGFGLQKLDKPRSTEPVVSPSGPSVPAAATSPTIPVASTTPPVQPILIMTPNQP